MAIVSQNASLSNWNPLYSNLDIDGTPEKYDTAGQLSSLGDAVSNINPDGSPIPYNTQGQLASLGDESSNLNPDGSPTRYDTQGQLASLGDAVSNINPDGSPTTYDTQGQLASLGDNSSNLNPDGTPIRYNTQGILYDLGDDSSNINPDGSPTRYDAQGQLESLGDNSSNLNPDGILTRYNTQGILYDLGDDSSDLNPDGSPTRYDTQGQLESLGDNSSDLNPDGILTRYNTQGILYDLGDDSSDLNPDGALSRYDTQGILSSLPPNASNLDFDGQLPSGVDVFPNIHANGFTIQTPVGVTQFVDPGNTSVYGFSGNLPAPADAFLNINANGFTIQAPVGVTQFIDPGNTSIYGFTGNLPAGTDAFPNVHANGFIVQTPVGVTQFTDPGNSSIYGFQGNLPAGTDAFPNSQANGFTIQAPVGVTQFIDPGNSSIFGFSGPLPPSVDSFLNQHANGFTLQNPIGLSQFLNDGQTSIYGWQGGRQDAPEVNFFNLPGPSGILSANGFTKFGPGYSQFLYGGQTSIYGFWSGYPDPLSFFVDTNAYGFTQRNPIGLSQFLNNGQTSRYGLELGVVPGSNVDSTANSKATNFFSDLDAKGFTLRQGHLQTNFVNISDGKFTPRIDSKVMNVPLGPWVPGIATMDNQLGQGSSLFRNTGFSVNNKYLEATRNADNRSLLAAKVTKRNSDSLLDLQYKKFNVRNDSFNPTYIAHPLILRGLQNPDKHKPQRWGVDTSGDSTGLLSALDGGFVRGGATTALVRSAIDTARIAKFMASPRGLIWAITQVGLGKSNALVEKGVNPIPFNDTRTHLGITSLLSVPGSAFGLHFTRHGIPFANEASSYEQVIKEQRNSEDTRYKLPGSDKLKTGGINRLLKLSTELFGGSSSGGSVGGALGAFQSLSNAVKGSDNPIIQTISGLGGPGSVYGIGSTNIRRYANTRDWPDEQSRTLSLRRGAPGVSYYAGILKSSTGHLGNVKFDNTTSRAQINNLDGTTTFSEIGDVLDFPLIKLWSEYVNGDRAEQKFLSTINNGKFYGDGYYNGDIVNDPYGSIFISKALRGSEFSFFKGENNGITNSYAGILSAVTRHRGQINRRNDTSRAQREDRKIILDRDDTLADRPLVKIYSKYNTTEGFSKDLSDSAFAGDVVVNPSVNPDTYFVDKESVNIVNRQKEDGSILPGKDFDNPYRPLLKAKTNHDYDTNYQEFTSDIPSELKAKLIKKLKDAEDAGEEYNPGAYASTTSEETDASGIARSKSTDLDTTTGHKYHVLPYQEIRNIARNRQGTKTTVINDFRKPLWPESGNKTFVGQNVDYENNNIHKLYGFGKQGEYYRNGQEKDVGDPYSRLDKNGNVVNQIDHAITLLKGAAAGQENPFGLAQDPAFNGDKINATDYISEALATNQGITTDNVYDKIGAQDFIKFYFSGIKSVQGQKDDIILFRATVKNITDTFSPSWNSIQVMGRPEGPGNYSTFERTLSFDFTAYASTREELVPMWRKLNYLSTLTMPVHANTTKPGGPLFRFTIGSMYNRLPAYFTALSMTINEEATWDLGRTADLSDWSKQLPNIVDVNCSLRIIHDWRHQLGGRSFSLYDEAYSLPGDTGNWLWDTNIPR